MASIVCLECKTIFSEYSDCCIKCGCPTKIIKEKKQEIIKSLLEEKEALSPQVLYLKEHCKERQNDYKEKLKILQRKEDRILESVEQQLKDEEKRALERNANEKSYYVNQLEKYKVDIQCQLKNEIATKKDIEKNLRNCSLFKRKEKEMLKEELEKQERTISRLSSEIDEKKEEKRLEAKIKELAAKEIGLKKEVHEKEQQLLRKELDGLASEVESLFSEYGWANGFTNEIWRRHPEATSVVNIVEKQLTGDALRHNYTVPFEDAKKEIHSIVSKLVYATETDIKTCSAFLSHMPNHEIDSLLWEMKKENYISILENDVDSEKYYYALSAAERKYQEILEEERKEAILQKRRRKREIQSAIHDLKFEKLCSIDRASKYPQKATSEYQLQQVLSKRLDELNAELSNLESTDYSIPTRRTSIDEEMRLVAMQADYESLTPQPKDASVIGRAVAGAAVAGPVGAIVGAASAMDKNIRNKRK